MAKIFRHIFRFHGFMESVRLAITGLRYLFLYHRNMRIIFLCGIVAFLLGIYKGLPSLALVALCITITLVFIAEIFNTATEMMLDLLWNKYHIRIKDNKGYRCRSNVIGLA